MSSFEELLNLFEVVNRGFLPSEVIERLSRYAQALLPHDRLALARVDDCEQIERWTGSAKRGCPTDGVDCSLSEATLAALLENKDVRVLGDSEVSQDPLAIFGFLGQLRLSGLQSNLLLPLSSKNRRLGCLLFSSLEEAAYGNEQVEIAQQLASGLTTIVEKAYLAQDLVRHSAEQNRRLGFSVHDLRTPLAIAQTNTELLKECLAGRLSEKEAEMLEQVLASTDRSQAMAAALLDLGRPRRDLRKLDLEVVDPAAWLQDVVHPLRVLADRRNVRLELELPKRTSDADGGLPPINIDRGRLQEVLENLITNAVRFSREGGVITVRAFADEQDFHLSVRDQGPGIQPTELRRVFDEFFQGSARGSRNQGSGLGLAIVKTLIESHGGQVTVESKLGEGATFTCILPLTPLEATV